MEHEEKKKQRKKSNGAYLALNRVVSVHFLFVQLVIARVGDFWPVLAQEL